MSKSKLKPGDKPETVEQIREAAAIMRQRLEDYPDPTMEPRPRLRAMLESAVSRMGALERGYWSEADRLRDKEQRAAMLERDFSLRAEAVERTQRELDRPEALLRAKIDRREDRQADYQKVDTLRREVDQLSRGADGNLNAPLSPAECPGQWSLEYSAGLLIEVRDEIAAILDSVSPLPEPEPIPVGVEAPSVAEVRAMDKAEVAAA